MKSKLLIMAALCAIAFTANAQTKGTNALSFGLGFGKQESTHSNANGINSENKNKNSSVSLGYGTFFKENEKIAIDISYGSSSSGSSDGYENSFKNYGAGLSYQKYYPLVKKLYAHAGGRLSYGFGKQENDLNDDFRYTTNEYTVGAFGGVSLFLSKRFALETNILSANMGYFKSKKTTDGNQNFKQETESTSFGISSGGTFNNLGFKIYLLF
ncbi:MAG: hypothetical protein V4663_17625 [Bacteroidota bacterium]